MSDCTNGGRGVYEQRVHVVTVMTDGTERRNVFNAYDKDGNLVQVDHFEVDGVRYERVRECEYKPMWNDNDIVTCEYVGMWWTGCGDALTWNYDNDECGKPPAFCPYCGGKVVN